MWYSRFFTLGPGILKGKSHTWSNKPLAIPAAPPTIRESHVIQVTYTVKVEVDVPWGFDPAVLMPVVLGTVPFRNCYGVPQQYGLPQEEMPVPNSSKFQ